MFLIWETLLVLYWVQTYTLVTATPFRLPYPLHLWYWRIWYSYGNQSPEEEWAAKPFATNISRCTLQFTIGFKSISMRLVDHLPLFKLKSLMKSSVTCTTMAFSSPKVLISVTVRAAHVSWLIVTLKVRVRTAVSMMLAVINATDVGNYWMQLNWLARNANCVVKPCNRSSNHLFLDLSKLQSECEAFVENAGKNANWSANSLAIARAWLTEGLRPRCMTRDLKWEPLCLCRDSKTRSFTSGLMPRSDTFPLLPATIWPIGVVGGKTRCRIAPIHGQGQCPIPHGNFPPP